MTPSISGLFSIRNQKEVFPEIGIRIQAQIFSVADPGWKNSGSGTNIPDHISESLITIFWVQIIKFFVADPDPGSGINIPDPQHCRFL
jgi:hypothetical protein